MEHRLQPNPNVLCRSWWVPGWILRYCQVRAGAASDHAALALALKLVPDWDRVRARGFLFLSLLSRS
jgi:hypothetical protein